MKIRPVKLPGLKVVLITLLVMSLSCSKETDYTNPENLINTSWRCISGPSYWADAIDYLELRFTSTTTVEVWVKITDGELRKDSTESYIISGNAIDIDNGSATGTIDGQKMHLKIEDDGPFLFALQ
jgi:hypothetical protein